MKKLSILFALLCVSLMGWAFDENATFPDAGTYANQFYWTSIGGVTAPMGVNSVESKSGFDCIYVNVGQADFDPSTGIVGCELAGYEGAGVWIKINSLVLADNEIYFKNSGGDILRGLVIHNNAAGAAPFDPSSIDWSGISNIGTSNFKIYFTESNRPSNYESIHIETAPWAASNTGIYVTFPDGVSDCSLIDKTGCWIEGAQVLMYLSAFTAQVTEVTITHASGTKTLYVYNEDGEPEDLTGFNLAKGKTSVAGYNSEGGHAAANDGNTGTRWSSNGAQHYAAVGAAAEDWWYVDLGNFYKINTIKVLYETACPTDYDILISNNGGSWTVIGTYTEAPKTGNNPATDYNEYNFTDKVGRYVKIFARNGYNGMAYGFSMYEFEVYGERATLEDHNPPTMTSAALSGDAEWNQVHLAVVATDPEDGNVASFHVVDATNGIDQTCVATAGIITVTGLSGETEYNFSVKAVDAAGNESASAIVVNVTTPIDTSVPLEAAPVPNATGKAVRPIYSDAFASILAHGFDKDGFAGVALMEEKNIGGDNCLVYNVASANEVTWGMYNDGANAIIAIDGYHSATGMGVDASSMTYLHIDIWSLQVCTNSINICINDAALTSLRLSHDGTGWNSYDIALSDFNEGAEGQRIDNVRWFKFNGIGPISGKMALDNVYFWAPASDTEAPVMSSASLVSNTATSAIIAVDATDNVGVFNYHVVDATNGIDANYTPEDGKITISGLTHNTAYNFTITAKDMIGNESENSKVVPVTTPFDITINLALNKTCEGGYYDNNPAESADKANDGDNGTSWVTYGAHAATDDWWIVDLGEIYNLTNITALWANDAYSTNYILQARVLTPATADKADDAAWVTLATVSGVTAGEEKSTNVSGIGRYIRFRSTANVGGFFRLREFRVYGSGIAAADTEKPVMSSASLVSNTDAQAVISVSATDGSGIASYHVVDGTNSIDANLVAEAGQITVIGLTSGTNYNFVITAVDLFGNESDNSKSVEVTTTAHYTEPQTACAAPTWDASLVKAMYSPTYSADCGLGEWGSGTTVTNDTYGKKYAVGNAYFGMVGFDLNCLLMEKVHFDIWVENNMSIQFVPIWGGAEQGITKNLTGQEWNSIDIDLTDYTGVTNWGNITQFKLAQMPTNFDLWIANAYFYREAAYVDTEAPTNANASLAETGFYSVKITASAEDNSGAVNFAVKDGDNVLATGAAASGVATTITVNGLTSGTVYNFNVVAYDDANNEAAPVVVNATTKIIPAPAPTPDLTAKQYVPVYSDAIAGSLTGIQFGGWGEATIAQWLNIAPSDQVFYVQNLNYIGWHSWGTSIDATGMQYLHLDIYSTGATQVNVTPISPGHEGVASITLTPNDWTSFDVDLSAYDANNIDWSDIFQFKFMNPVGGNELMIDNVYFWKAPDFKRDDSTGDDWMAPGELGTICIPNGAIATGGDLYELVGKNEIGKLVFATVPGNVMVPGKPYLFQATSTAMNFFYTDDAPVVGPVNTGAMKGTFVNLDLTELENVYYFAGHALWDCSDLTSLEVKANRAYVKMDEVGDATPNPAPGRRYITMDVHGNNAPTGMDEWNAAEAPVKMIIEGQLFILRGEKLYNANGQLVK